MAVLLCLETSTTVCSVSLSNDGAILAQRKMETPNSHAQTLTVFIDEVMKECNMAYPTLDAIAVSEGPGSYTGLRIGVSTAKGLCYGLSIPLIAISTLQTMAHQLIHTHNQELSSNVVLIPMIDARRMEVYSAHFNIIGEMTRGVEAEIIDELSYQELLSNQQILFFGNGAEKLKETIISANAIFVDGIIPLANDMVKLATQKFEVKDFVDVAYYEPFYLKEFMVSLPKKKVL